MIISTILYPIGTMRIRGWWNCGTCRNSSSSSSSTRRCSKLISIGTVNGHLCQSSQIRRLFGFARERLWHCYHFLLFFVVVIVVVLTVFVVLRWFFGRCTFVAFSLAQSLRGLIHGPFVGHRKPKARLYIAFHKSSVLLFDGLHNGLGHEELGMLGTGAVQGTIASNQTTVPFVARVVIRHAPATAQDVLVIYIKKKERKWYY